MAAINHILVPTDGSEGALKAAGFAADLARALGARISVLGVLNEDLVMPYAWGPGDQPGATPYGNKTVEEIRSMLEQRNRENALRETVDALGEQRDKPASVVVWGHPADEICEFARGHDVDLIVIGSHGRSGIKRVLLGSVSHAVANQASCPVTIVR